MAGIFDSFRDSINAAVGNPGDDGTNALMRMGAALQGKDIPMGASGMAFQGEAFDAQVANELYKQGLEMGLDPATAKRRAIDKIFASRMMTVAGPEGQVITGPSRSPVFGGSIGEGGGYNTGSPPTTSPSTSNLPPGYSAITPPKTLTAEQKFAAQSAYKELETGESSLKRLIDEIEANPNLAGTVGTVRETGVTGLGVVGDIARAFGLGGAQDIAKSVTPEGSRAELEPIIEQSAYGLARLRKGSDEKLTQSDVDSARKELNITGATSSPQVLARLKTSLEEMEKKKSGYRSLLGEVQLEPAPSRYESLSPTSIPGSFDDVLRSYNTGGTNAAAAPKIYKYNPKTGKIE